MIRWAVELQRYQTRSVGCGRCLKWNDVYPGKQSCDCQYCIAHCCTEERLRLSYIIICRRLLDVGLATMVRGLSVKALVTVATLIAVCFMECVTEPCAVHSFIWLGRGDRHRRRL